MKRILLLLVFGVMGLGLWAQTPYDTVNVYDPQAFTEMTTIDPANFQFIGRKNSLNRRVHVDTMRNYMTPAVVHAWLGDPLDSVNVLSSYWRQFVTDSLGRVWYVDADGDAKMLLDPTGGSVGSASAGYLTWWNTATTITNTDVAYTSTLLDADMLTGAFGFPLGTTAQRPGVSTGRARFNSDLGDLEFYNGSAWRSLPESSANAFTAGQFIIANPAGILSDTTAAGALSMMSGTSGSGASPQVAYWSGASTLTGHANLLWDGVGLSVGTTLSAYTLDVGTGGVYIAPQSAAVTGAEGAGYWDSDAPKGMWWHDGTAFRATVWGDAPSWTSQYVPYSDGAKLVATNNFQFSGTELRLNNLSDQGVYGFQTSSGVYAGAKSLISGSATSSFMLEIDNSHSTGTSLNVEGASTGIFIDMDAKQKNPLMIGKGYSLNAGETEDVIQIKSFTTPVSSTPTLELGNGAARQIKWTYGRQVSGANPEYAYTAAVISPKIIDYDWADLDIGYQTYVWIGGAITLASQLDSAGLKLPLMGGGNFTGTPTYYTAWDANGRLIEVSPASFGIVGAISTSTDGSGDVTVTHGMGTTPTAVLVTPTGTTPWIVSVHTIGGTTFKVRFYDAAGAAVTSTAVTATWLGKT